MCALIVIIWGLIFYKHVFYTGSNNPVPTYQQLLSTQIPINGGAPLRTMYTKARDTTVITLTNGGHDFTIQEVDTCAGASGGGTCFIGLVQGEDDITYVTRNNTRYALAVFKTVLNGSGVFYNLLAFESDGGKAIFVASQFLGDRTPPQSIEEKNGLLVIKLLTREGTMVTDTYDFTGTEFIKK